MMAFGASFEHIDEWRPEGFTGGTSNISSVWCGTRGPHLGHVPFGQRRSSETRGPDGERGSSSSGRPHRGGSPPEGRRHVMSVTTTLRHLPARRVAHSAGSLLRAAQQGVAAAPGDSRPGVGYVTSHFAPFGG